MKKAYQNQSGRQRGFTLLEVLIALLVLSIGLLGLAALQTTGMRSNQMASMRTLVSQFAYDITDRMRVNQAAVDDDYYVIALNETPADTSAFTDKGTSDNANVAYNDLLDWRNNLARLPGGTGVIAQCDTATCPVVDSKTTHIVTVYWNESRDPDVNGYNCPPESDTDHRCFRLITR